MMGHRYSLNFIIYSKYFSIDIKYYYNLKKKSALVEINGQMGVISLKENLYFLGKNQDSLTRSYPVERTE